MLTYKNMFKIRFCVKILSAFLATMFLIKFHNDLTDKQELLIVAGYVVVSLCISKALKRKHRKIYELERDRNRVHI